MARKTNQRGQSAAVEATLILPALVAFAVLVAMLAGQYLVTQHVGSAAAHGARAASLERDIASARAAALDSVANSLERSGVECLSRSVTVDAAGLKAPLGAQASLFVSVTCSVAYPLTLPGFPSSHTVTVMKSSPVDAFRSR